MYTLKLTEEELQSLAGLLDAGVKALGIRAVKDAANLLEKLETVEKEEEND
jgi:hypothetical protein